ncbi:MAG: hypothetical protein JNN04_06015 [Cyclobacteriaceae bacterium]|nr:hypothetical protein [Cyclobacteriaceae bacterium]
MATIIALRPSHLLPVLLLAACSAALAQTPLNQSIPLKTGQRVKFTFDYPELIRISTWDKNEIAVRGTVSINNGENDDAFALDVSSNGDVVEVRGRINDMDNLPHRITVVSDGVKTTFKDEAEWRKYRKENGKSGYDRMSRGVDLNIQLEIFVPVRVATQLVSVYGMVEVRQFDGPLRVEATYGGVDASLTESVTGELVAETNYGHIYSDLKLQFDASNTREENFHTLVTAKPGKGPAYRFESAYGNVYLRRSQP